MEEGHRVIIYMPMIPEAVVAMLACCRIGAIYSVVFGGFSAKELSTRIAHAKVRKVFFRCSLMEAGFHDCNISTRVCAFRHM